MSSFNDRTTTEHTFLADVYFYGEVEFNSDVLFKQDVKIEGTLDLDFLQVTKSFDVGVGGSIFTADALTRRVGVFTDTPVEALHISTDGDEIVVTEQGVVGIGTTIPGDFTNDGTIKLDLDGSISIQDEIYDSRNLKGAPGNFLSKDALGITWVSFEPSFTEGIFLMDEGVYVPTPADGGVVGAGQSFTILDFVQTNSLGVGTDTLIPTARDASVATGVATVFTQDLWGFSGSGGEFSSIYRNTRVGIKNSNPSYDLDVTGTLHVTSDVEFDSTLDVDGDTTLNATLDVDGDTTLNATLDVDGATTLNTTLDVDGDTTLNATLDVDGVTTLNSELDVDGATTLNNTLDVDGIATFNDVTDATSTTNASVQIDGGVGIVKKLIVGDITKIQSTVDSTNKDSGALVVEGGVGIEKNLNVGVNAKVDGSLELESTLIDVDQNVGPTGRDFRLSSTGSGVKWRPSGVETENTIWVSKDGSDSNSGLLEGDAKATIGGAAAVAQPGDTIKIRPGRYVENNPIGLQRDVSITGEDIRLVTVEPQNTSLDVFWVRRGCLIENLNFAGATIGTNHFGCGAVAFPKTGTTANSGYTSAGPASDGPSGRWRSPYIRNCTNFMTASIGMRIDGDDATGSVPGADLKSMVCDSFTQYNEAGIGVSITNDAYAQLVSIFTINCDKAIYVDTGGQCDLTNSNSSFGNFGLVAVGLGATQYTGTVLNDIIPGDNSDVFTGTNVIDGSSQFRRPFDGQAAYFKIDLGNYPDTVGTGTINAPLQELESITVVNGGTVGQFSQVNPPTVVIRDSDGTVEPKGPQGIVAEASATVNDSGQITQIDVINSGRNYLPTQNMVVDIDGDTTLATAKMSPIYFTVAEATENNVGITTITFNEFIPYEVFSGDVFTLQRISRILTSSHSFEYVGSGTDINTSLPFQGALPIKENEIVALDGAQIPFTATDQRGNFDIGEGIQVDQTTSTVRGRDFSKAIQAEVTPLILALR